MYSDCSICLSKLFSFAYLFSIYHQFFRTHILFPHSVTCVKHETICFKNYRKTCQRCETEHMFCKSICAKICHSCYFVWQFVIFVTIRFDSFDDSSKFENFVRRRLFYQQTKLLRQYRFSFSRFSSSLRDLKKLLRFRDECFRLSWNDTS